MRPIFDRFPKLRGRVRFEPLFGDAPTPVGEIAGVVVKRDDLVGGGKIRKLEFFHPARPLLAVGSEGSNWLRALARRRPQTRFLTWPQHHNPHSRRNVAAIPGTRHPDEFLFGLSVLAELPRVLGGNLDWAPIGGSCAETTLGWVNAGLELAGQVERGETPRPDAVFVPLGTCGTAAGLALGFALAGLDTALHAVRITMPFYARRRRLDALAGAAARILEVPATLGRVLIETEFYGGYAVPTPASKAAQAAFAPLDLDSSYAAKAAAACLARKSGYRRPLLWLTSPSG